MKGDNDAVGERVRNYVIYEIERFDNGVAERLSENEDLMGRFNLSTAQLCVGLSLLGEELVKYRKDVLVSQRGRDTAEFKGALRDLLR